MTISFSRTVTYIHVENTKGTDCTIFQKDHTLKAGPKTKTGPVPLWICPKRHYPSFSERGARPVTNFLRNLSALSNWHSVYTSAIAFIVSVLHHMTVLCLTLCCIDQRSTLYSMSINWPMTIFGSTWQWHKKCVFMLPADVLQWMCPGPQRGLIRSLLMSVNTLNHL